MRVRQPGVSVATVINLKPIRQFFQKDKHRRQALVEAQVVPDPARCVQCGICSYNCPIGIDVRRHVWQAEPVVDSHCLTCGECVMRCPRGVLRFERLHLFISAGEKE